MPNPYQPELKKYDTKLVKELEAASLELAKETNYPCVTREMFLFTMLDKCPDIIKRLNDLGLEGTFVYQELYIRFETYRKYHHPFPPGFLPPELRSYFVEDDDRDSEQWKKNGVEPLQDTFMVQELMQALSVLADERPAYGDVKKDAETKQEATANEQSPSPAKTLIEKRNELLFSVFITGVDRAADYESDDIREERHPHNFRQHELTDIFENYLFVYDKESGFLNLHPALTSFAKGYAADDKPAESNKENKSRWLTPKRVWNFVLYGTMLCGTIGAWAIACRKQSIPASPRQQIILKHTDTGNVITLPPQEDGATNIIILPPQPQPQR
jgi:hypothetical protein